MAEVDLGRRQYQPPFLQPDLGVAGGRSIRGSERRDETRSDPPQIMSPRHTCCNRGMASVEVLQTDVDATLAPMTRVPVAYGLVLRSNLSCRRRLVVECYSIFLQHAVDSSDDLFA